MSKDKLKKLKETMKSEEKPENYSQKSQNKKQLYIFFLVFFTIISAVIIFGIFKSERVIYLTGGLLGVIFGIIAVIYLWRKKKYGQMNVRNFEFIEKRIPLGKELYVLGTAVPTQEDYPEATEQGIIERTEDHDKLVISDKPEEKINKGLRYGWKFLIGGLGILLSGSGLIITLIYQPAEGDTLIKLLLLLGTILSASLGVFYKGFKELGRQETSESLPTSNISSMAMGLVELKGKAKPTEELKAPFTGEKCAGYHVIVKHHVSSATGGAKHWETIHEEKKMPVFYLDDGTGSIPVDPETAEIELESKFKKRTKNLRKLPEPAQNYVKKGKVRWIKWKEDNPLGY